VARSQRSSSSTVTFEPLGVAEGVKLIGVFRRLAALSGGRACDGGGLMLGAILPPLPGFATPIAAGGGSRADSGFMRSLSVQSFEVKDEPRGVLGGIGKGQPRMAGVRAQGRGMFHPAQTEKAAPEEAAFNQMRAKLNPDRALKTALAFLLIT